ncbi:MAG: SDR family NAD(P)-dependent oxidoreductase [Pseudomonadota bacterium]
MSKKILITGATDGIGLLTAKKFKQLGHEVIVHGRNQDKLSRIGEELSVETYRADMSNLSEVKAFAEEVLEKHKSLDVLINNAGVYKTKAPLLQDGQDVRFVVNTIAPYLLTKELLPIISQHGRIINLSSAAQASVNFAALLGKEKLGDFEAYAQSKLAITMWSRHLAGEIGADGPVVIAVNPGSLLGTKMVKEGFGTSGNDISIGVDILTELTLEEKYVDATGKYWDNDNRQFAPPADDGLDEAKTSALIGHLQKLVAV